jgi:signal transduction histidine kinase
VAFAGLVGGALVRALVADVDGSRPLAVATLVVWMLAYPTLGVPGLAGRNRRLGTAYLAVLVAVVGVVAWQEPSLLFVMFLVFPSVWFFVSSALAGVGWTVAVGISAAAGPLFAWTRGDEPLWGPGQTIVGVLLSVAMGLWVHRVLEQSDQRATLIRELESTRSELAAAHHQQGVLAERERLTREVHDTLAQGYTSIVVLAQTAAAGLPPGADGVAERLALIEEVARENLGEARAMVAAFSPLALDSATLVEALERLVERFGRETGLGTRLDTAALGDGSPELSRAEEVVLLRGAQEALANVRRHASATSVVLRVSRIGTGESAQVSVHVEDDGSGFDPAESSGVGLAGLRTRAEEVGGSVDVVSAPGEGTRVTVRVPGR